MLKAGICGFGGLGHVHANSLWSMDGVEIRSVCDIDPEQLAAKEVKFNIAADQGGFDISGRSTYTDFREMLDKEDLDFVVIATPTDFHAEYSIMAMEAGRHIFCEKPMALTVEDCDRMVEARNRTGRELMIGQCLRFWPQYEYLHECLKDGRYGKLRSLSMERIGTFHKEGSWFNDHRRSGGAIIDLHVHDVDWVQMALGRPENIYARGRIGFTGGVDDVSAIWNYGNGPLVTIRGSWMYTAFRMNYTAFFQRASVEYHPGRESAFTVRLLDGTPVEGIEMSDEMGYSREMRYFVECVRGEHPNKRCPAEGSRESIAIAVMERNMVLAAGCM